MNTFWPKTINTPDLQETCRHSSLVLGPFVAEDVAFSVLVACDSSWMKQFF